MYHFNMTYEQAAEIIAQYGKEGVGRIGREGLNKGGDEVFFDEVVTEAVRGSGETLLQDGATPDRWINKWGAWTSKPSETVVLPRLRPVAAR